MDTAIDSSYQLKQEFNDDFSLDTDFLLKFGSNKKKEIKSKLEENLGPLHSLNLFKKYQDTPKPKKKLSKERIKLSQSD